VISWGPAREEGILSPPPSLRRSTHADDRGRHRIPGTGRPEAILVSFRKGLLALAGAATLAGIGAWLSMTANSPGSAPVAGRVLAVALLAAATSLLLHGTSYLIAGVREFRTLRASKRARRPALRHR
jgi:hypothetical protein